MNFYEITLARHTSELTNLDYATANGVIGNGKYCEFYTTENFPNETKEVIGHTTLTGRSFKHVKWRRKLFNILIASNEINDKLLGDSVTKVLDFLLDFWRSDYKYIYYHDGSTGGNYIEIETESDIFPVEYAESIIYVPMLRFNLFAVLKES